MNRKQEDFLVQAYCWLPVGWLAACGRPVRCQKKSKTKTRKQQQNKLNGKPLYPTCFRLSR